MKIIAETFVKESLPKSSDVFIKLKMVVKQLQVIYAPPKPIHFHPNTQTHTT